MICSDIWHKYYEWYFEIVIPNFYEPLGVRRVIRTFLGLEIETNENVSAKKDSPFFILTCYCNLSPAKISQCSNEMYLQHK